MKPSENIVGKGENAGNQHFLLVTSIFSFSHNIFYFQNKFHFSHLYFVRMQMLSIWNSLKRDTWLDDIQNVLQCHLSNSVQFWMYTSQASQCTYFTKCIYSLQITAARFCHFVIKWYTGYEINIKSNPLPDDKVLALSKLKAFVDYNLSLILNIKRLQ